MLGNWFLESWIHFSTNPWEMFIVECYIFISNIATDKLKDSLNATVMKFDCWLSFDQMKIESYIFVHTGPFHTLIIGTIDKQLSSCLADFVC